MLVSVWPVRGEILRMKPIMEELFIIVINFIVYRLTDCSRVIWPVNLLLARVGYADLYSCLCKFVFRCRRAQQYSDNMDAAERVYTDNVMPTVAEGARQLLSALHDHKRAVLESSMYTLQEAQALLARLRGMSAEGASLDSRPLHIKTNIEFSELIFYSILQVFQGE